MLKRALGVLMLSALLMHAQSTDASLAGSVVDASQGAIPSATVTMTNVRTGVVTTTTSNDRGVYSFPTLPPGQYRLTAEKQGFRKAALHEIHLEVGARVSRDIELEVGSTAEVVEVIAQVDNPLSYVTATISGVVTERKVLELPVSSRSVLNLTTTQAGTNGVNFNGARRGALNISIDGINVQDQRINQGVSSTIFASVDRVQEFRVITQPIDAELGRGSAQVQMITRSGTNEFHGSLFNFHRNTVLNANTFFNNLAGVDSRTGEPVSPRERLIRNQYGARIGGPILKNRTFFHFLWESQKIRATDTVTTTVWTESMRRGQYRFFPGVQNANANAARPTVDLAGNPLPPTAGTALSTINIFSIDPNRSSMDRTGLVQKYIDAMPLPNWFRSGDGLNTAGYRWNRPYTFDENNFSFKMDHTLGQNHRLTYSMSIERNDEVNDFMPQVYPGIGQDLGIQRDSLHQATLTSTLSPTVVNEFRVGALRPTSRPYAPWEVDPGILATAGGVPFAVDFVTIADPVNISNDPQGRISPNYQFFNKTSMIRGKHNMKFGGQLWFVSSNGFNSFDVLPRAVIGAGGVPVANFASVPGLGLNQTSAQNILNDLNGSLTNVRQALNSPGGRNPQFLAGEPKQRVWRQREWSVFFQDDWKVTNKLSVNLGLRYEFYGVPHDKNGKTVALAGGSQTIFGISGADFSAMFRPGANAGSMTRIIDVGPRSSNPDQLLYNNDWNNLAPAVSLAYSLPWLGERQTVFRAGYGVSYERLSLRMVDVVSGDAAGLRQVVSVTSPGKFDLAGVRLPLSPLSAPLTLIPFNDRVQTARTYDTGLRVPIIHNYNASLTHAVSTRGSFGVRYVASKGVRLLRGADVNEHNIFENGILDAFNITRAGGNAELFDRILRGLNVPGRGVVNGTTLTGSQVLRDVNTTTQAYFASGSVGTLASFLSNNIYLTGQPGGLLRNGGLPENFVSANPQFSSARIFGNLSSSTYHSLQVEYLQRARDLTLQWNYTFAKSLGDEEGDLQEQNDSFRTQRNRSLDKRLVNSSAHHIMRTNAIYQIPVGRSGSSWLTKVFGGWQVGGIFNTFSGDPIGFTANGAATFNNWADNTPVNHMPVDRHLGSVQRTGNGVVFLGNLVQTPDPSIQSIASATVRGRSTLRAIRVGDENGAILMSNPVPGQLGTMNQRVIYGPFTFRFDANVIKNIPITERVKFQLNAILENATNTPQFGNPTLDMNDINTFGRITSAGGNRIIVIGGRVNF